MKKGKIVRRNNWIFVGYFERYYSFRIFFFKSSEIVWKNAKIYIKIFIFLRTVIFSNINFVKTGEGRRYFSYFNRSKNILHRNFFLFLFSPHSRRTNLFPPFLSSFLFLIPSSFFLLRSHRLFYISFTRHDSPLISTPSLRPRAEIKIQV